MAQYFSNNNVPSCAVISGNFAGDVDKTSENQSYAQKYNQSNKRQFILDRKVAIEKLKKSEIKVIFSVDIFNEGLDIPDIDMVLFLRPTESPTVFLQQLGRGLRCKLGKKYLNVLDFIGNYKKANLIPLLLSGDFINTNANDKENSQNKGPSILNEESYPDGCIINFDFKLIDMFKRMDDEQKDLLEKIKDEYYRIKDDLGQKPLRLQMYTYMDESLYVAMASKSKLNIFKDYISFLRSIGELSDDELLIVDSFAHAFLKEIENTAMTKTYKMPLLLAFYNHGEINLTINDNDIHQSFKDFYSHSSNSFDLKRDNSTRGYKDWGKNEYLKLARNNPIKFMLRSSSDYFYEDGDSLSLNAKLKDYIHNPAFIEHFKDIIDFRTRKFYRERLEKKLAEAEHEESKSGEEN
jgi:hypothetical protein